MRVESEPSIAERITSTPIIVRGPIPQEYARAERLASGDDKRFGESFQSDMPRQLSVTLVSHTCSYREGRRALVFRYTRHTSHILGKGLRDRLFVFTSNGTLSA